MAKAPYIPEDKKKVRICITITPEQLKLISDAADRQTVTTSVIVRQALNAYFAQEKQ